MGNDRLFVPGQRDGIDQPFVYLRQELSARGYKLRTADGNTIGRNSWVWFWDIPEAASATMLAGRMKYWMKTRLLRANRDLFPETRRPDIKSRTVLFLNEPAVISPRNWNIALHDLFPIIFTWSDNYVDGVKYHKFHCPLAINFPEVRKVPFSQRKLLVNISANKTSEHPDELYSARREVIRHFQTHYPSQFDLFGVGWDEAAVASSTGLSNTTVPAEPFSSYRGTVQNKWDVYPFYRFAVCYENMRNAPGWVTEKIFDCLRAGCVPVYLGAPNVGQYVDPAAFIDRRHFASDECLAAYLNGVSETDYGRLRQAAEDYLHSPQFKLFLPEHFTRTIIDILNL